MSAPTVDLSFPHHWHAEILGARPLILPPRHFVYPRDAEEVERGALEVHIRPNRAGDPQPDLSLSKSLDVQTCDPFLATCALGFRDPVVPTGVWSTPEPEKLCAVSGGYAYIIDTTSPDRFTMIPYRPVLEVRPVADAGLLLFVGHRSMLAWGADGQAWESEKLSDEGVTVTSIENGMIRGMGWEMLPDQETPFVIDMRTGRRSASGLQL